MKLNRLWLGAVALLSASALALTGCGSTEGSGATGAGDGAPAVQKEVKELTIGFLQKQLDAPYFNAMKIEAERISKEQGFKLLFQSANGDPVTQLNQAQTMLSQGADALIVNAISPETQKTQLQAIANNIPLIFVDTGIPDVGVTAVTSDNFEIGKLSGELTAKRFTKGKSIDVGILTGGANDEIVGPQRQKGFLDGLTAGGIPYKVVAESPAVWAQDKAVPVAESMLAAHPDVQLIIGLNDAMALGALTVLQDQKNTTTLVAASADGQKEALAKIKEGGCEGQYVSTGLNSPSLATERGMEIAISIATGQKTAKDFDKEEFTKAAGINCDNVDEFYSADNVF
ncbi:sugar ABC transporter substrate-binding protein [Arthrobacter psychrochitiniphilus]|uniref:Sugar ABC transporter substrate-binding protein n=1 Tax=Arthrobacter psychrochitiniphilus TaxID=291045 RepID=A0A2V3DP13_9MICC|nr:sugar ABC transporter substrate-binding protein [Arthrobacter psychrochitiniphilus]NYG16095.1 ABC-type sugar transport system substrate-binding protein [Arthrobacter psychrochitiniphilus]PXA63944.1 sugar ABC transporter substrate-binding protein [Arthrobacter psychrochitiniphilus]